MPEILNLIVFICDQKLQISFWKINDKKFSMFCLGDFLVHVMLPEVREKYQIESLHIFGPEYDTTRPTNLWFIFGTVKLFCFSEIINWFVQKV